MRDGHNKSNTSLWATHALTPAGWRDNVLICWDSSGVITSVEPGIKQSDTAFPVEFLVPGMVNIHSHAFQRGFAGLSEYRHQAEDSFWSWRQLMYEFANGMTLEQFEVVATFLYREMLAAGYTSVCEFHYLHHQVDGTPFPDPAAMSRCLIRAADKSGIGLTLLPVFYQYSGFGRAKPIPRQNRFIHDVETMLALWEELYKALKGSCHCLGIAPHSLRAVDLSDFKTLLANILKVDPDLPVHMHIAEQQKEVDDCLEFYGKRPVEWLMEQQVVNSHWCLIHATHMTEDEYRLAAQSGAIIGLCPSTEANLGDGIFNLKLWHELNGQWGIGSDSNTMINPAEELMILEYSQRLRFKRRNVYIRENCKEVGQSLYLDSVRAGARAAGRKVFGIEPGQYADFVSLDGSHPAIFGLEPHKVLAGHIFSSSRTNTVNGVWTRGKLRKPLDGYDAIEEVKNFSIIRRTLQSNS